MREILFRGKRVDNGGWVYGDLLNVGVDYDYEIRTYGGREHGQVNAVSEETVGQYTGLRDHTRTEEHPEGRKIFEGDIVRATFSSNCTARDDVKYETHKYEVKFHEKYGYFYLARHRNNMLFDGNWAYYLKTIEIIGNIHDNPELLKEGESK